MINVAVVLLSVCVGVPGVTSSALSDYVFRPDPHYKYEILRKTRGEGYTHYVINMTSQKWLSDKISNHAIWWHYLSMVVPDKLKYPNDCFLFIDGGSNHKSPPNETTRSTVVITMLAISTGMITGNLHTVPNEPISFVEDPTHKSRKEDLIIAWTWKTFVDNNHTVPEYLLRFPMTKAVVRAMDTLAEVAGKLNVTNKLDRFYLSGASKRGWTTWTAGAVDPRVKGIVPVVMDLLHMVKNLHHQFRAYGGWTFAFKAYYELNFTQLLDNPRTQLMADYVDPISFKDTLTMPKLIISATGDEFFLLDDSHYYYNDLIGPKYLKILPNAEHSCIGHTVDIFFTIRSFILSIATAAPLPELTWKREITPFGGRITVFSNIAPLKVNAVYAHTLDGLRRDFRLFVGGPDGKPYPHPVLWYERKVQSLGNNSYMIEFEAPQNGWLAFLIQVAYPGVDDSVLEFTTETQIIPDTFPFPDCHGDGCHGTLV
ncbi:autocrine proliferation repressor protein A-like [Gigantopelta aegis]|uniref:autocrine proliferation repressor protein A-like n=1 Tax=Gigantopelta aegis TaxID=1735272 RepID=UPI001B88C625|nr:autocrine proliferation repressor protein A-like [Gigantopelta aegis]XP_041363194.1 autocrine proliferation repressor protein A-like [Gigantopelta aegis]XP_041363195.1 autocrine proliferation repressor protein A-like [Gigantopelta aegis]